MTQSYRKSVPYAPMSDAETLLERLSDEGLAIDTSLAELLAYLDARYAQLELAAGAAGGVR